MRDIRWIEASSLDVSLPYDIIETVLPFTARLKTERYSLTYCSASCQSIGMPMTIIAEDIEITLEPPRPVSSYLVSYHSICFLIPPLCDLSFILNDEGLARWSRASKHVHGHVCGKAKLDYLCMCVQHFCPRLVWVWPLGCTLQSVILSSPPVWAVAPPAFSKSSSHLSVLDLPTAPHCSQGEPPSPAFMLHVRLTRICPGPPSYTASKNSLNVIGFTFPSALALKVSLSQGSWSSLPPALQQVLRYIWQRSENVKKAGPLTHTHPTFSFKVSHLLPVYLRTVLQGIPGSLRKQKHTLSGSRALLPACFFCWCVVLPWKAFPPHL